MKKKTYLIYIAAVVAAVAVFLSVRTCASGDESPSGDKAASPPDKCASRDKGESGGVPEDTSPQPPLPAGEGEVASSVIPTGAREARARAAEESATQSQAVGVPQRGIAADSSTPLRSARNDEPGGEDNSQPAVAVGNSQPAVAVDSSGQQSQLTADHSPMTGTAAPVPTVPDVLAVPDTVPPPDTLSPFSLSPFPRYEAGLMA